MPPRDMPDRKDANGWDKQALFVRKELERLSNGQDCIVQKINDLRVQVAMLKVKSGVWGAMGACIPVAILLIIQLMNGG